MIILIGNQKGGTGKSTLVLLLANYLTHVKKRKVRVIDMDDQQQLVAKAERAKILENMPPYPVIPALGEVNLSLNFLAKHQGEIILIDLPPKLADGLIPLLTRAAIVFCPFSYDEFSVSPTLLFAIVIRKINPGLPLVFIPNRIKTSVHYETKLEVDKALQSFGGVTPALADKVDFQRITTFHTPMSLHALTLPILELIYEHYILKYEK
ncbi:ParA family protein [Mucilaginibacter sabulilitoris]|uniref:ParA family protein n=1 Tax=Mucilaginibacter sabulilitoris TaxID=1173583 RepID=A0ABZ0TRL4_9SPHI|nr:ParA family protein [Mucilaginibacter sabulilitoris]WPU95762.1 ParA family protein [Mucilaginibacter sabulilitoris]